MWGGAKGLEPVASWTSAHGLVVRVGSCHSLSGRRSEDVHEAGECFQGCRINKMQTSTSEKSQAFFSQVAGLSSTSIVEVTAEWQTSSLLETERY